jgi:hypothetical protein
MLRRSKIFIATGIQIAVSSAGAPYYATLGRDRPHSSIIAAGFQADSSGRKLSVRFSYSHSQLSTVIKYFKTDRSIVEARALAKNTRGVETLQRAA